MVLLTEFFIAFLFILCAASSRWQLRKKSLRPLLWFGFLGGVLGLCVGGVTAPSVFEVEYVAEVDYARMAQLPPGIQVCGNAFTRRYYVVRDRFNGSIWLKEENVVRSSTGLSQVCMGFAGVIAGIGVMVGVLVGCWFCRLKINSPLTDREAFLREFPAERPASEPHSPDTGQIRRSENPCFRSEC